MLEDLGSPHIEIAGHFAALERGLQVPHPEWMVPDEVVEYGARRWGLLEPGKVGIDPFAGTGSIPDVINRMGGQCHANELDPEHCDIIEARLPAGSLLRQGDYRGIRTPDFYWGYDYIYTSPPFERFIGRDLDCGGLAYSLNAMLADDGVLVIDSAAVAERGGTIVYPAAYTILYFEYHGFSFKESCGFQAKQQSGCDSQFTELLFTKKPL